MAAVQRKSAHSSPWPTFNRGVGDEGMMSAIARMAEAAGVPPTRLMTDFATLAIGPGRIDFADYERLRLYDEALWGHIDRRAMVGVRRGRELAMAINFRHDCFALASDHPRRRRLSVRPRTADGADPGDLPLGPGLAGPAADPQPRRAARLSGKPGWSAADRPAGRRRPRAPAVRRRPGHRRRHRRPARRGARRRRDQLAVPAAPGPASRRGQRWRPPRRGATAGRQ